MKSGLRSPAARERPLQGPGDDDELQVRRRGRRRGTRRWRRRVGAEPRRSQCGAGSPRDDGSECRLSTESDRYDPYRRSLQVVDSIGAGERTRTADLLITNQLLYQLSYAGNPLESMTCEDTAKCRQPVLPAKRAATAGTAGADAGRSTCDTCSDPRRHDSLIVPRCRRRARPRLGSSQAAAMTRGRLMASRRLASFGAA